MIKCDQVNNDSTKISTCLNDYQSKIDSLNGSWEGASYNNLTSKASEFVSKYNAIVEQMNSYAKACELYEQYENEKKQLNNIIYNIEEAQRCNIKEEEEKYKEEKRKREEQIDDIKKQIENNLAKAASTKLTASSQNPSSGTSKTGTSNSTQKKTTSSVPAADSAIEPHSLISNEEREKRVAYVGDTNGKIVTIDVPYWDGESTQSMKLTVNEAIADNYKNAFTELAEKHFPINPETTGAYVEKYMPSGRISDHGYGTAIDINWDDNPMLAGPNPNNPDENPYVVTEEVVEAFAKQGFYWGADWPQDEKDYMHFTWTGW